MSKPRQLFTHDCPNCGARFTDEDVSIAQKSKAYYILHKHGLSLRAVGRLFDAHPQSVKYHMNKFEEQAEAPIVLPEEFKQEFDTKPSKATNKVNGGCEIKEPHSCLMPTPKPSLIEPLDIYNLDGFANYQYKDSADTERLDAQLEATQDKINEIVRHLNDQQ